MSDEGKIPVLTDVIESGIEITMSDLGLDDDMPAPPEAMPAAPSFDDEIEIDDTDRVVDPFVAYPGLEQAIRRILDEHMELALQEIKHLLERELTK